MRIMHLDGRVFLLTTIVIPWKQRQTQKLNAKQWDDSDKQIVIELWKRITNATNRIKRKIILCAQCAAKSSIYANLPIALMKLWPIQMEIKRCDWRIYRSWRRAFNTTDTRPTQKCHLQKIQCVWNKVWLPLYFPCHIVYGMLCAALFVCFFDAFHFITVQNWQHQFHKLISAYNHDPLYEAQDVARTSVAKLNGLLQRNLFKWNRFSLARTDGPRLRWPKGHLLFGAFLLLFIVKRRIRWHLSHPNSTRHTHDNSYNNAYER